MLLCTNINQAKRIKRQMIRRFTDANHAAEIVTLMRKTKARTLGTHIPKEKDGALDSHKTNRDKMNRDNDLWLPLGFHKQLQQPYRQLIREINQDELLRSLWNGAASQTRNPQAPPRVQVSYAKRMRNHMMRMRSFQTLATVSDFTRRKRSKTIR